MVTSLRGRKTADAKTLILNAVNVKRAKGDAYAAGKTLVVFLNAAAGQWLTGQLN